MTSLRSPHPASPEGDSSGDTATPHDHLLTSSFVLNGNGTVNHYQYKHHPVYDLGAPRPRPVTGSGVVFRRHRHPCWCILLVIIAVVLMAAGISLGVLFGIVRKAENDSNPSQGQQNSSLTSETGVRGKYKNGTKVIHAPLFPTRGPLRHSTPLPSRAPPSTSTVTLPDSLDQGSRSGWGGVTVRAFKAFWHPGDSRVLDVLLSNRTILQAAGHKANDGTFRGLYSLSISDGHDRTTRLRFMGMRNLASIILPDGTAVTLDWSANNADVECKIFQIPASTTGAGGYAPPQDLTGTSSHLATLQLGVHSFLLRQISKALYEASAIPISRTEDEGSDSSSSTPTFCAPRLPVKVTKCGGQYPYDGAFVQGEVTMQSGPALNMVALPWQRQDDNDACYKEFRDAAPNFFIPLPGHMESKTATVVAEKFWSSAARWWARFCDVVEDLLEVDHKRHEVCDNMAASAQAQLSHRNIYNLVYDSCSALLTSLYITCRSLSDISAGNMAASDSKPVDNSANAGRNDANGSRRPLTQDLLQRVFANSTSLQEPVTSAHQRVHVRTIAFCPSTQPMESFEKLVFLQAAGSTMRAGNSLSDITAADMVHVNCPGHPEVTYFYLGHAAAIEPLDAVKHRLKVCAICALDKMISVRVQRDFMCCNDTCKRESQCEDGTGDLRPGYTESHTFEQQNSVYCHEFLTRSSATPRALQSHCLGTCQSSLEVRFQVRDSPAAGLEGRERVYQDQVLTCHEGYRSTCKTTFGH